LRLPVRRCWIRHSTGAMMKKKKQIRPISAAPEAMSPNSTAFERAGLLGDKQVRRTY